MKRGQTIIGEREKVQSASERMQERQKQRRTRTFRAIIAVCIGLIVVVAVAIGWALLAQNEQTVDPESNTKEPQAELVDEAGLEKIPGSVKTYAVLIEQDLGDLGRKVTRVTLPNGKSRELYIDIEGRNEYYKVATDRDAAVTAEDVDRMIRYLDEKGLQPEYVDVRVEGKAFYK